MGANHPFRVLPHSWIEPICLSSSACFLCSTEPCQGKWNCWLSCKEGFPDFYLSHIYQSDFCQATFTHHTFTHQDFYLSLVLAIKKTLTHQFETFTHQSFISSITNDEAKKGNPILAEQSGFSRHLMWTMTSPNLVLHSHFFSSGLNAIRTFLKNASVKAIFLM